MAKKKEENRGGSNSGRVATWNTVKKLRPLLSVYLCQRLKSSVNTPPLNFRSGRKVAANNSIAAVPAPFSTDTYLCCN